MPGQFIKYEKPKQLYTDIYDPINNYIYLYHTNTLILIPNYPDNISDSSAAQFGLNTPLGRSAPIYSYQGSGPRSVSFLFLLHRDMLDQVNVAYNGYSVSDDYVDLLIKEVQAAVLPSYSSSSKMVDPPLVAVRVGNDIYIKGVISGAVLIGRSGPLLKNDKYAIVNISFTVNEVDPYEAYVVQLIGSFRDPGDIIMNTSMDLNIYRSNNQIIKDLRTRPTRISTL